jgi:ABC-type transporter Mla subunit MlaD
VTPGSVIDGMPAGTFDAALDALAGELDPHNPAGLVTLVKTELDADNARSVMAKIHRSVEDLNLITKNLARQTDARDREALLAKLGLILDYVNEATGSLRDQLTLRSDEVVLGKLHKGLDTLNADLEAVRALIQDNRPTIDDTLAGLRQTVDTVQHGIAAPLAEQLDTAVDASLLNKLHVSFDRLNRSLADLTVVTGETRQVLVLNKERLNGIFANVNETSAHLKAASKEIRRSRTPAVAPASVTTTATPSAKTTPVRRTWRNRSNTRPPARSRPPVMRSQRSSRSRYSRGGRSVQTAGWGTASSSALRRAIFSASRSSSNSSG